jgi:hypothetical protein
MYGHTASDPRGWSAGDGCRAPADALSVAYRDSLMDSLDRLLLAIDTADELYPGDRVLRSIVEERRRLNASVFAAVRDEAEQRSVRCVDAKQRREDLLGGRAEPLG